MIRAMVVSALVVLMEVPSMAQAPQVPRFAFTSPALSSREGREMEDAFRAIGRTGALAASENGLRAFAAHDLQVVGPSLAYASLHTQPALAGAAGRDKVGRVGLAKDAAVHEAALARVTKSAAAVGLASVAMTPSPITGATGNQEFLIHSRASAVRRGPFV